MKFNTMSILVVLVLVAHIVTTLVMMNNQQVTNDLYDLVGTSETLRIVSLLFLCLHRVHYIIIMIQSMKTRYLMIL